MTGALFVPPIGIIFGYFALGQIKRTGENGRVLAVAGLVIGYLSILLVMVLVGFVVVASSG